MRPGHARGFIQYIHSLGVQKHEAQLNAQPPPPGSTPTRHQRRANQVFNERMAKRLKKDGTPAIVEVLPDGGIHIDITAERNDDAD